MNGGAAGRMRGGVGMLSSGADTATRPPAGGARGGGMGLPRSLRAGTGTALMWLGGAGNRGHGKKNVISL